jgi:hypothetical protein
MRVPDLYEASASLQKGIKGIERQSIGLDGSSPNRTRIVGPRSTKSAGHIIAFANKTNSFFTRLHIRANMTRFRPKRRRLWLAERAYRDCAVRSFAPS